LNWFQILLKFLIDFKAETPYSLFRVDSVDNQSLHQGLIEHLYFYTRSP